MIESDNQSSRLKEVNREFLKIEKETYGSFIIEIDPAFHNEKLAQSISKTSSVKMNFVAVAKKFKE